jgi:hypothetical protein
MDKVFPPEIKRFARTGKKVFISDVAPIGALDCPNCGGVESFALFVALRGPFQSPGTPGAMEGNHYLTSHYDESLGVRGGWWVGITYTFPCPVCLKGQPQKPLKDFPTQREINFVFNSDTEEVY